MLRLHPFALIILVMPLKAVEKAVMNNGLDKKHGQYFLYVHGCFGYIKLFRTHAA